MLSYFGGGGVALFRVCPVSAEWQGRERLQQPVKGLSSREWMDWWIFRDWEGRFCSDLKKKICSCSYSLLSLDVPWAKSHIHLKTSHLINYNSVSMTVIGVLFDSCLDCKPDSSEQTSEPYCSMKSLFIPHVFYRLMWQQFVRKQKLLGTYFSKFYGSG